MKKIVLVIFILLVYQVLFSQISGIIPSGNSIASTSVSDSRSWTAFNNPAMLGYVDKAEIGIQYENRFIIDELSTKSFQAAYSTQFVNMGLSFAYFGYSLYHEMLLGLGFARNFSDKFALGVQFNYLNAYFSATNEYKTAFFPQIGLNVSISPVFNIGFNTFNPFQINITTEYIIKRIPSVFSLGTEYFFSKDLVWRVQIDKEISSNYRFASGFDYEMLNFLKIKLGAYAGNYLVSCLGLGIKTGAFFFDLNGELHPLLGLNTFASVKYRF
ncbi:MAG: hypothetical protein Q7U47_00065 [Paludibacter sp.]|nr:hypothetical protein [Paludibacter sp.]